MLRGGLALALVAAAGVAQAMTVERMQVDRDDGRYRIVSSLTVDVPLNTAFRAATDYERLPEFNPSVLSNQRLAGHRLRSRVRFCAAFFCKTIRQVMRYREAAPHELEMRVIGGSGDLKSGYADWRFTAIDAGRTRLTLESTIEPAFWVPPLVGPYLIAGELKRQTEVTGRAIERLAGEYAQNSGRGDSVEDIRDD